MAQRQLSRTLPKNFTFPFLDDDVPKTPERPSTKIEVPPPPRHSISSCRLPRVRARAGTDVCARMDLDLFQFRGSDVPLPSIEFPQSNGAFNAPFLGQSPQDEGLLAPPRTRMNFKTPPAQIRGTPFEACDAGSPWPVWDQTPGPIKRPDSVCSNLSDSSVESIETFASRPSVGSCTSVESDLFDPYFPLEFSKETELESPSRRKSSTAFKSTSDKGWTREMDNHLWNTYQIYLQDPTMTPFKMTPGSIPPLGVTSRVSRRAKKTWDNKRSRMTQSVSMKSAEPGTPKATIESSASQPNWPKTDAKTRRRLKTLCRRKFSISPHYQRIMQSRTPEPTEMAQPAGTRPDAFTEKSAYTTRDLGVSLVTSNEPNPIARVTQDLPPLQPWNSISFNDPVPATVEPRIVPTPSQHLRVQSAHSIPRLGSPFVYSTWGPGGSNRQVKANNTPRRETIHAPGRRTRRNTYLEQSLRNADDVFGSAPSEIKNSDEDVDRRLEDYLRDNKLQDMGHGRVRLRSRGATTGGVNPRDVVDQLFSPPSSLNSGPIEPEETTPVMKPPVNPLLDLGENIKRLGSPFKIEGAYKRREAPNRFIRHAPSLSDPFSSGGPSYVRPTDDTSPMQISPTHAPEKTSPVLPYNAFEEGLSDAERIRRQILNMPFTRN